MSTLEGVTPFPPEFAARYRELGYWEDLTIGAFFDTVCADFAERVALVAGSETVTYTQLAARAERLALHLLDLGLQPRDRVVVQLPNVPEFVYLYLALQKVGAIPIMALAAHRYHEISHFVKLSDAVGYVCPNTWGDFDFAPLAAQLRLENPSLNWVMMPNASPDLWVGALRQLLDTEPSVSPARLTNRPIDPTDPALFQLSGGTTGVPKLIPRTHNDYLYNSKAAAAVNDIGSDDSLLIVLPIAHNFPLACPGLQGFLMHGARVVLSTSTQPADILQLVQNHSITHLELVPALLIRLLNTPNLSEYNLSSLRVINSGGQKLQTETKRRAEQLICGCKVQEVFGMGEGLLCYVRLDDPDEVRYETVGRPISPADELRLVDDEGRDVPDGTIGELLVRGPYTLRGYYKVPEYNAKAFTADGYYKSGDLMRRTPGGNYIVEGRKKDLINRGGEKISAEEIEDMLLAHPSVFNAACVPQPDPVLGERVCAFVIFKPGTSATLDELNSLLLARGCAKYKLPERLVVVDEFPLSRIGKVLKSVLANQLASQPLSSS